MSNTKSKFNIFNSVVIRPEEGETEYYFGNIYQYTYLNYYSPSYKDTVILLPKTIQTLYIGATPDLRLKNIIVPEGVKNIEIVFSQGYFSTDIELPSTLESITLQSKELGTIFDNVYLNSEIYNYNETFLTKTLNANLHINFKNYDKFLSHVVERTNHIAPLKSYENIYYADLNLFIPYPIDEVVSKLKCITAPRPEIEFHSLHAYDNNNQYVCIDRLTYSDKIVSPSLISGLRCIDTLALEDSVEVIEDKTFSRIEPYDILIPKSIKYIGKESILFNFDVFEVPDSINTLSNFLLGGIETLVVTNPKLELDENIEFTIIDVFVHGHHNEYSMEKFWSRLKMYGMLTLDSFNYPLIGDEKCSIATMIQMINDIDNGLEVNITDTYLQLENIAAFSLYYYTKIHSEHSISTIKKKLLRIGRYAMDLNLVDELQMLIDEGIFTTKQLNKLIEYSEDTNNQEFKVMFMNAKLAKSIKSRLTL